MEETNTSLPDTNYERMEFKVTGNSMNDENGFDLSSALQSLSSFENLIIKTYLQANGKQRFTVADKSNISIQLKSIRQGSLISEIGILYNSVILPTIPLLVENGQFIIDTIRMSYDFLKEKISNEKEGKTVEINQNVDNHSVAVTNTGPGNVTVNVYPGIPTYAEALAPTFQKMANSIDGDYIETISLTGNEIKSENKVAFNMSVADKELFQGSTVITEDLISISGKIINGNFKNQNGQIEITACTDKRVNIGDTYSFSVAENLNAEEVWKEMFLEDKPYFCSLRLYYNPAGEVPYKVQEIIIQDWDTTMWDSSQ